MTIYEKAMAFYKQPPRPRDDLDEELVAFCHSSHQILTGKSVTTNSEPTEERDDAFIRKYPAFNLSKLLGRGSTGSVFLGQNDEGVPLFAIKTIHLPDAVGKLLPLRRQFLAYNRLLRKLTHPSINPYLGWTVIENEAQVYTEYCEGGSLSRIIELKGGIKNQTELVQILCDLVSGLVYIHSHGIIHRDLKPGNILMKNGKCRIVDFGSARIQQTCCGTMHQRKLSGTANYLPPEVIRGDLMVEHAGEDIWALGCCLYEMVTGNAPWYNFDNPFSIYYQVGSMVKNDDYNELVDPLRDNIDELTFSFMQECLAIEPESRATSLILAKHPLLTS